VDLSDLPYRLESLAEYPIISAYSFIKSDFSLGLEITPRKDASVQVAIADQARGDSRLSHNGILTSSVKYTVRNMSEQFFKFNLPENAEVLNATINGTPQQVEKQEFKDKDTMYLINIKKHQDTNPFNLAIMYRQNFNIFFLDKLLNYHNFELPRVLNMPILTLSWSIYAPESMKYWNFSSLNTGKKDYLHYISQSNLLDSRTRSYTGNKRQTAFNYLDAGEIGDSDKVTGILPPEFSMPPVKGLRKYKFAGYLPGSEFIDVSMLGIAGFIYYLVTFFLLIYLVWQVLTKIHKNKFIENKPFRQIIKLYIPELAGIFIIGFLMFSAAFWLRIILTITTYTIFVLVKSKFNRKQA
ncbi:MAG: hypothetical protein KAQ92_06395, partial [Candidatus Aenigmarchaeota archaeon]|nr:hypothetical protein [Candidatus Aenigmarchaeota archaeon]